VPRPAQLDTAGGVVIDDDDDKEHSTRSMSSYKAGPAVRACPARGLFASRATAAAAMLRARVAHPACARVYGALLQVDIRLVVPVVLALLGCVYIAGKNGGGGGPRAFNQDRMDEIIGARVAQEVKQQLDHKMRLMSAGAGADTKLDAEGKPQTSFKPQNFGEQKQTFKKAPRKMRVLVCRRGPLPCHACTSGRALSA
jgi:hypothetical protein